MIYGTLAHDGQSNPLIMDRCWVRLPGVPPTLRSYMKTYRVLVEVKSFEYIDVIAKDPDDLMNVLTDEYIQESTGASRDAYVEYIEHEDISDNCYLED